MWLEKLRASLGSARIPRLSKKNSPGPILMYASFNNVLLYIFNRFVEVINLCRFILRTIASKEKIRISWSATFFV